MDENEVRQKHRSSLERKEDSYAVASKERLMKIIAKKMEKTFIGNISEVEHKFGFLWGHGKKEGELNDDELFFRQMWKELRNIILNKGNDNIRAVREEIEQYTINWNRYHVTLIPIERDGE